MVLCATTERPRRVEVSTNTDDDLLLNLETPAAVGCTAWIGDSDGSSSRPRRHSGHDVAGVEHIKRCADTVEAHLRRAYEVTSMDHHT